MAEYSRREVHTTRVEFLVPAPYPHGASWIEIGKAAAAATQEMRTAGLVDADAAPPDDSLWVRPGDGEVIVSYETSQAYADTPGR